jgi:DNA (cytosine-5)-methyltransferase 1
MFRMTKIRALDLFCGAGGSSWGAKTAGISVVGAVDRWALAEDTYTANFPKASFFRGNLERTSPRFVKKTVGQIQLLLASPECTNHTCAKGGAPRSERSKGTAFQVVRFAEYFKPRWIVVENVVHMRTWHRYGEWKRRLETLGYKISEQVLDAADFGVPQSRRRLFVLCDKEADPPEIKKSTGKRQSARTFVNLNGKYNYSLVADKTAPTKARARRAIKALGSKKNFLMVYYGSDGAGGWQKLGSPLRTITTLDRFGVVKWYRGRYRMRMLQVPELKRAMGFPVKYKLPAGVRRDRIKLLGNAVCPPVMRAIVRNLTNPTR